MVATGRLCVRPLAGASLNPLARVGEQLAVSFLPPGSITILNYGYRLISAIGGSILFRSMIVALLPRLTEATANDDRDNLHDTIRLGTRIMLTISLLLTALMAVLAKPAAVAIYGRGSFSASDSEAAVLGWVLAVYSASLVGSAVQRSRLAHFFARLDTRVPFRIVRLHRALTVVASLTGFLLATGPTAVSLAPSAPTTAAGQEPGQEVKKAEPGRLKVKFAGVVDPTTAKGPAIQGKPRRSCPPCRWTSTRR